MKSYDACIIDILQHEQDPVPLTTLAKRVYERTGKKVDRRTIASTIQSINTFYDELTHQGALIQIIRKKGCQIERPYFEDGPLRFLLDSLSSSRSLSQKEYLQLKAQLMKLSSHQQMARIGYHEVVKEEESPLFQKLNIIIKAMANQRTISFEYYYFEMDDEPPYSLKKTLRRQGNYPENPERYLVSPYDILLSNEHYYLLSYSDKHPHELTLFRIDRMEQITTAHFQFVDIKEMFDMKTLPSKLIHMYTGTRPIYLKMRCSKTALQEVITRLGKGVFIQKELDDVYYVEKEDVLLSNGLIGWLLMLSNQVRVIEPVSLKEEIIQRLKVTLEMYQGDEKYGKPVSTK